MKRSMASRPVSKPITNPRAYLAQLAPSILQIHTLSWPKVCRRSIVTLYYQRGPFLLTFSLLLEYYLQIKKNSDGGDYSGPTLWVLGAVDPKTLQPIPVGQPQS
jgi:hypothetical protein